MKLPSIAVETEQRGILNIKKIIDIKYEGYKIHELEEFGNYHVIGKVDCVVKDEEDNKILYSIDVEGRRIDISTDEISDIEFENGDWVEFDLVGLSLYDEGY